MPSTRTHTFIDATVIEGDVAPTGRHQRDLPPASPGLRAPADVSERSDHLRRRERKAKIGRPRDADTADAVNTVFAGMKKHMSIVDIADEAGVGEKRVKSIMTRAKGKLQEAVEEYVDIHLVGAKVAALKGDTRPAEWALENIDVEGERAVTPPQKHLPAAAPTFNLGFVIGGIPQRPQLPQTTDK